MDGPVGSPRISYLHSLLKRFIYYYTATPTKHMIGMRLRVGAKLLQEMPGQMNLEMPPIVVINTNYSNMTELVK
jgi:hypothetical protein